MCPVVEVKSVRKSLSSSRVTTVYVKFCTLPVQITNNNGRVKFSQFLVKIKIMIHGFLIVFESILLINYIWTNKKKTYMKENI